MIALPCRRLLPALSLGLFVSACILPKGWAEVGDERTRAKPPAAKPSGLVPSVNLSPRASVVTDVRCDTLVEPFELTNNLVALAKLSAEMGMATLFQQNQSAKAAVPRSVKTAAKNMNWMPITWEKMYGEDLHKQRADVLPSGSTKMAKLYEQGNGILKRILAQITDPHPFEFKLSVTDDPKANAEAYPGGYLYLSKEALDRGPEYAAFALAHEIGHVTKRHTTKETQARIVDSVTTFDELKQLMAGPNANPATVLHYGRYLHGLFLNYSREQESQADGCAIRLLAGTPGIEARKAADAFLRDLREDQPGGAKVSGHVSTHPSYPERKKRIELLLAHWTRKRPK